MLDENAAIEVIHLVLQTDGKQAIRLDALLQPILVELANGHMLGAFHLVIDSRH